MCMKIMLFSVYVATPLLEKHTRINETSLARKCCISKMCEPKEDHDPNMFNFLEHTELI